MVKIRRVNEVRSHPRGGSQSGTIEQFVSELIESCRHCDALELEPGFGLESDERVTRFDTGQPRVEVPG